MELGFLNDDNFWYVIFLLIAPILGTGFVGFLDALRGKPLPPFLVQVNSQTFGQAIVVVAAAFLISHKEDSDGIGAESLVLLIGIMFLLLFHALLDRYQERLTDERVREVLDDSELVNLKSEVDRAFILDLAQALVDVDFFPESGTNWASGWPRQRKRRLLVRLINDYLSDSSQLDEAVFLVPESKRRNSRYMSVAFTSISFGIYVISILLFVSGTG